MIRETVILLLVAFAATSKATKVADCRTGATYEDADQVKISDCESPPCILKQKTKTTIELRLVPERDIKALRTSVHAKIAGFPVPFIGVDGSNACDLIYNGDGTKAGCPLAKGTEYVYKNSFPVLPIYPRISTTVHWALTENREDITCFEVPARITA